MNQFKSALSGVGSTVQLFLRAAAKTATLPRQFSRFIDQCYVIGYTTLPIVAILMFSVGAVLALQSGYAMRDYGAKNWIGNLVGLSMAKELGPMMVAILVAGRVGSAIAAELASMKVYQEVDALETMNISPAQILVLPRLAAIVFMMPVLTIIADIVGWFGGAVIARYVGMIGISQEQYFAGLRHAVAWRDLTDGLLKAEVFGFVVVLVCCNIGLNTRGGPREIGASVTRAVVVSLIMILVLDYFVTKLLLAAT